MPNPQKGFVPIAVVILVLLAASSVIGGAFFIINSKNKNQTANITDMQPITSTESAQLIDPKDIVSNFFEAVKNRDRTKARTFLSANANKIMFKSTLEDSDDTESLYSQDFSLKITSSNLNTSGNIAYVDTEITASGQLINSRMTLIKEKGQWLISDNESIFPGASTLPSFARAISVSVGGNSVLLHLIGPADFYLTDSENNHSGTDPNTKSEVNEIKNVTYGGGGDNELESLAITYFSGTWELKIIGRGSGKYTWGTEIVLGDNNQAQIFEGNITAGEVKTYIIRYPTEPGIPLEITAVNE